METDDNKKKYSKLTMYFIYSLVKAKAFPNCNVYLYRENI